MSETKRKKKMFGYRHLNSPNDDVTVMDETSLEAAKKALLNDIERGMLDESFIIYELVPILVGKIKDIEFVPYGARNAKPS